MHSEEPALLALPSNWPGSACRSASSGNLEIRLHLVRFQETRGALIDGDFADIDNTGNIVRAGLAEFIGVFILVFFGCAAAMSNPDVWSIAITVRHSCVASTDASGRMWPRICAVRIRYHRDVIFARRHLWWSLESGRYLVAVRHGIYQLVPAVRLCPVSVPRRDYRRSHPSSYASLLQRRCGVAGDSLRSVLFCSVHAQLSPRTVKGL